MGHIYFSRTNYLVDIEEYLFTRENFRLKEKIIFRERLQCDQLGLYCNDMRLHQLRRFVKKMISLPQGFHIASRMWCRKERHTDSSNKDSLYEA